MIPAKLREEIERWIAEGKYGNIQINFGGGRISSITRHESIRLEITNLSGTTTLNGSGPSQPGSGH